MCVYARPAPRALLQPLSSPAPHPNCVSFPHKKPPPRLPPTLPKSPEWPPSSSTGGTIDTPPFLPPSSLTSSEDTLVLKVCHNNRPEEELFWAQTLSTQAHTDPRQTYIVLVFNSQRVPTRLFCHVCVKLSLSEYKSRRKKKCHDKNKTASVVPSHEAEQILSCE